MTARESWRATSEDDLFTKTQEAGRSRPLSQCTREQFACASMLKCARCGVVFTQPVAYTGIAIACKRTFFF